MKKLYFILISFIVANVAMATSPIAESETYSTEFKSGTTLIDNNFENILELKTKISELDITLTKFDKCATKNKVYIGNNVAGADIDGCVNIQAPNIKIKSKKPIFAGFLTTSVLGTLTSTAGEYNTNLTTESWNRVRADSLCNKEFASSRAMNYHDIKFMFDQLPNDGTKFTHAAAAPVSQNIWMFDIEKSLVTTDKLGTKFASTIEHNNCAGWTSADSANNAVVLNIDSLTGKLSFKTNLCNEKALIACVK